MKFYNTQELIIDKLIQIHGKEHVDIQKVYSKNYPDLTTAVNDIEKEQCIRWLKLSKPIKEFNLNSYSAKHIIERWCGIYISNDSFKEAVYELGIPYKQVTKLNINIGISRKYLRTFNPLYIQAQKDKEEFNNYFKKK